MEIQKRAGEAIRDFRLYWNKPPKGRYMTFKEIFSLSFGGMGVRLVTHCVSAMMLYVGNTLIGNTIGIKPSQLYIIYIISVIINFPLTALRANMIDSVRNKKGKYRPYILSMGLPTAVLAVGFIWMPYEEMSDLVKCAVVLLFNIALQFFYHFYGDAYGSLINVLSPNTIERSDVCSIVAVIENFSPSVANIVLPLLARMITGENTLFDMRVYRVLYPPFIVFGFILSLLVYANTREKIVQAKTHVVHMRFIDALLAVARNKYFWIISCAGWIGFLESSFGNIHSWLYNYQEACSAGSYSLIVAISGNASLWPMLAAPFVIRAVGKRNMLIAANLLNILFILMMYPVIQYGNLQKIIWLFTLFIFVNNFAGTLGSVLNPSLNADIRDYQHYITGERIDGMFVAVGLVGSLISLATGFVLPAIYEEAGLNEAVAVKLGYSGKNVYDVLYDTEYFRRIGGILIIASVIGAILNVIPFFFYDLTEIKQKAMVTVLKIRALFEDYGNDALSDEALVEAIDIIEEAQEFAGLEAAKLSKDGIRAAKKGGEKDAVKQAKRAYKDAKLLNEKIIIAGYVSKEIRKFDTPEVRSDVRRAELIAAGGINAVASLAPLTKEYIQSLPKSTQDEKEHRRTVRFKSKQEKYAKRAIRRHYPNGLAEFDSSLFNRLFAAQDDADARLKEAYDALDSAKKEKSGVQSAQIKEEINSLKAQKIRVRREIRTANKEFSFYNVAARPYLDAKKLLIQQENYRHYEDIKARYEKSKERAEAERLAKEEAAAREKAGKEAFALKLKDERKSAKEEKKSKK